MDLVKSGEEPNNQLELLLKEADTHVETFQADLQGSLQRIFISESNRDSDLHIEAIFADISFQDDLLEEKSESDGKKFNQEFKSDEKGLDL